MSDKTLILIDGHALAFRSFHALERTGMKTTDGVPTWAVFGFFRALFDILKNKDIKPDSIAVAFDVGRHTFRVDKYQEYKANRASMPDELRTQLSLIVEGLKAFNIPIYTKEGFEADDVIGTIAKKIKSQGDKIYILTGDRDSFQLVDKDGHIVVIIPQNSALLFYDWQKVYEKMGVYPNQVIDFKALSGDTSDNIPGIRGIGPKTACNLLEKYENLENIYKNIDEITQKSLKEKLVNGKEEAYLSQYLATIDRNVDIDFNIDDAKLDITNLDDVVAFFKKLQLYGFIKNIESVFGAFNLKVQNSKIEETTSNHHAQLNLFALGSENKSSQINSSTDVKTVNVFSEAKFKQNIIQNQKEFDDFLQKLKKQKLISFDVITDDETNAFNANITGIAFGFIDDFNLYDEYKNYNNYKDKMETFLLPLNHSECFKIDLNKMLNLLKPVLENASCKKTGSNIKFALNVLNRYDIKVEGIVFDVVLASYVYDANRRHLLSSQAQENLDFIIDSSEDILGRGKNALKFCELNLDKYKCYGCQNAYAIYALTHFWLEKLNEVEKNILFDIELPLTFVLAIMEQNGVSIDVEYLEKLNVDISQTAKGIENRIFELAEEEFNINSPKKVGEILFDKLNLKVKGKKSAKNSTNAKVLEQLAENYEIASKILEYRHLMKLKSTYIEALPKLINTKDKRIHTTYNQFATNTGRLSSTNPNLQNIPIRTEIGAKIRQAFVPRDKETSLILSADYSQIELRLLAHFSEDENLIEAFQNNVDVHALTASKVYGVDLKDVTKDMRRHAKAVNFGIVYGQTKYGLASALNISKDDAQNFIDKYFETYKNVKKYMEENVVFALKNGYAKTFYGRKRYLPELTSSNKQIQEFAQRAAINSPLQGTASDLIKIAMIDLNKKLKENHLKSQMIIQVHDELVLEVLKSEVDIVKNMVVEAMELNQPLKVPLVVDVNLGESWMKD